MRILHPNNELISFVNANLGTGTVSPGKILSFVWNEFNVKLPVIFLQ